jgi:5-methylthioadenosine/S-adenosylhomocysteine deaminase
MRIAINQCKILTMTDEPIFTGSILIDQGKILEISEKTYTAEKTIDGKMLLAMPGLVNAHTHIAMSLLRNYADDLPFWPWLTEKIWPAEANLSEESVYWGSMLSIAEMIASGTTAFNDMYFFTEETIKAIEKTGIRANLCRGLVSGKDSEMKLENGIEIFKEFNKTFNQRLHIDLGPHAPYTCKPEYLKRIGEVARELKAQVHIHLSESEKEVSDSFQEHGKSPIAHVADLGLLDNHVIAAHCVHITDDDLEIMKNKDFHIVNNPSSNLKLANGFAQVHKMKKAGINVALGTDGPSSNNNQDMFEEMHLAAVLNKSVAGDTTFLPAYEVLEMATINGAKALGIDHLVGSLEEGKQADLILLDLEKPHLYPHFNLMSMLVYSASSSDVKTVIVDGKILYDDYKFTNMDLKTIYREATKYAKVLTGCSELD